MTPKIDFFRGILFIFYDAVPKLKDQAILSNVIKDFRVHSRSADSGKNDKTKGLGAIHILRQILG